MTQSTAQEFDLRRDWDQLARSASIIFRYPRTIALITLACTAMSWLFTMTREPVYRSSATLKLEDPIDRNPALEVYKIPMGVTEVEEALAILRSEAIVEQIIAAPSDGQLATPEHPEWGLHLGLTTLVDDELNQPLRGAVAGLTGARSGDPRVYAFVDEAAPGAPERVRLRFLDRGTVVVSRVSPGPGVEWKWNEPVMVRFREGEPLRAHGLTFRLALRGDFDERTFILRHMSAQAAVRTFMGRLRATDLADQKGMARITVEDPDPVRSAAVANAICQTYLAYDRAQVSARANSNVKLLEQNLESVRLELSEVEGKLAKILTQNRDAIDPDASSRSLLSREAAGEARLAKVLGLATQLRAMVKALEQGDHEEVSRIGPDLNDAYVRKMIEDVVLLQRDLANVAREGLGDYNKSIQVMRDQKIDDLDDIKGRFAALQDIVEKLEQGDASVLSRLGSENASDGAISVDWITRQHLSELGGLNTKLLGLRDEYVEGYELITLQEQRISEVERAILELLRAQRAGLATRVAQVEETRARWDGIVSSHPDDERGHIETALAELWLRIEGGIQSRLRGVEAELELVRTDLQQVSERLSRLPLAQHQLAAPMRQRDALRVKVDEWTRDMAQVNLARLGVLDAARILDAAHTPRGRVKPVVSFGVLAGLVIGLILALGSTTVYDRFRGRPRSQPELEEATGLAVCAVVPASPRAADRTWMALKEEPDGPVAEAYRTLRSRLRGLETKGRQLRTVAITSCQAGEGKTAVNAGLAAAFAMEGRRVLLVDANLRDPRMAEVFGQDPTPGLAEALDGRRHWVQSRRPTAFRDLDLLVAGDHHYSPGDLLGGVEMERFLEDALTVYDMVVLDLPHTLGLPDVAALAPHLDALLLLYSMVAGPTTQTVQRTVQDLIRGGAPLAGTVQVTTPQPAPVRNLRVA